MQYIEGLLKLSGTWVRVLEFRTDEQELDYRGLFEKWAANDTPIEYMDGVLIYKRDFAAFRGGDV